MTNTPYTPKDYGNEARAKDVLSRINKPKATPYTPTYCCTNHCTAKGKVCPCEAVPDQVDALDEILASLSYGSSPTDKWWIVAKAKLSALLVEAELNGLKWVAQKGSNTNHCDSQEYQLDKEIVDARIKELEKQREA